MKRYLLLGCLVAALTAARVSDWNPQRRFFFISKCMNTEGGDWTSAQKFCMCYQGGVEALHSWAWVTDGKPATPEELVQDEAIRKRCGR